MQDAVHRTLTQHLLSVGVTVTPQEQAKIFLEPEEIKSTLDKLAQVIKANA